MIAKEPLGRALAPWLTLGFATALLAQEPGITNGDFEHDAIGEAPRGWFLPPPCKEGGYSLLAVASGRDGDGSKVAAELRGKGGNASMFGNCMRSVDPGPLRGKRVRFSALVRCEPADATSQAQLWLRVDRPHGQMGFFDNMGDRPIRSDAWRRYEIVGTIADDAEAIVMGLVLIGGGATQLDDARLEIVGNDVAATGRPPDGEPGLTVVAYAADTTLERSAARVDVHFPLPLAYRDQTPLTFRLQIVPADVAATATIDAGPGENRVLHLTLHDVEPGDIAAIRYESTVLVAPSPFDAVPATVPFPSQWPADAAPWLAPSWCCDSKDARVAAIGKELRAQSDDVRAVIGAALQRSQAIFQAADGRVHDLTAVEALDHRGSCTSCANLVAALLRAGGVPARVLAGYPLWSGPLQTHYIVEAFVPAYGWYPVESTLGKEPWPNCQQIAVSIVPPEHEAEPLAHLRGQACGGVPFLTLTETAEDSPLQLAGTRKQYCDHEASQLRAIDADPAAWQQAQQWARARWAKWLESKIAVAKGAIEFGPASDKIAAKTLAELQRELR